jgi:hypothetical protein
VIRHYEVLEKDAFIEGVREFVGVALKGGDPAPLNVIGHPKDVDELAARREPQGNRPFSLVSLSILSHDGPTVTAQDMASGRWVKISPSSDGEFIIEEVSE